MNLEQYIFDQEVKLDSLIHQGVKSTNAPVCGVKRSKLVAYGVGVTCDVCKQYSQYKFDLKVNPFLAGDLIRVRNDYVLFDIMDIGEALAQHGKWVLTWWPKLNKEIEIVYTDLDFSPSSSQPSVQLVGTKIGKGTYNYTVKYDDFNSTLKNAYSNFYADISFTDHPLLNLVSKSNTQGLASGVAMQASTSKQAPGTISIQNVGGKLQQVTEDFGYKTVAWTKPKRTKSAKAPKPAITGIAAWLPDAVDLTAK